MNTKRNFGKYLLTAIFILAAVLLTAIFANLRYQGWHGSAEIIMAFLGKAENPENFTKQYFTLNRYNLISWFLLSLGLFSGFAALLCFHYYSIIDNVVQSGLRRFFLETNKFLTVFRGLTSGQKKIAGFSLVLITCVKIYFLHWFPAHTDEVYSYLFFVKKGFLTTVSYYPVPNNHVLFNLICGFFNLFPLAPLQVMRIPVFITSLLVSVLLFGLLKREVGFKAAYLAAVFFSISHFTIYFSVHGRGYMLLCLFALLATFALYKFLTRKCRFYLTVFAVSSVFGFYTIPVFIYPFTGLLVFTGVWLFFRKQYHLLLKFSVAFFLIVFTTAVLYAPILITSGLTAITGKDYQDVQRLDFSSEIKEYGVSVLDDYSGFMSLGFVVPLFCLGFTALYYFRNRHRTDAGNKTVLLVLFAWIVITPIIFVLGTRLLSPSRVWLYWSMFQYSLLAIGLSYLLWNNSKNSTKQYPFLIIIAAVFSVFQIWRLTDKVQTGEIQIFKPLPFIVTEIVNGPAASVYTEHEYYNMFILFGREELRSKIETDIYRFDPEKRYDYLLILNEHHFPAKADSNIYTYVWKDHKIKAYRLKTDRTN